MRTRRTGIKRKKTTQRLRGEISRKQRKRVRPTRSDQNQSRMRKKRYVRKRRDSSHQASVDYSFVLRKNQEELSVIVSVSNEEETIEELLKNVQKLQPKEIIVVENGSTDATLAKCLKYGVRCFSYSHPLGHDVGRAIGAQKATGSILLFIDGDMVLKQEEMLPFVADCYGSNDIVLNNINPFLNRKRRVDSVSIAKSFLNQILQLPELKYSSLTAVPHAIKKSAVELIGAENLCVPPKAMAIAVLQGLKVGHVVGVNVIKKNKIRPYNSYENNYVEQMILGDHVEAFQYIQQFVGKRGFFSDHIRRRDLL